MLCFSVVITTLGFSPKEDGTRTAKIKEVMRKVCDWQLSNFSDETVMGSGKTEKVESNGWIRGTFYTGVMATYYATGYEKYLQEAMRWAEKNNWQPAPRTRHADDHCAGQTYLELFFIKNDTAMIAPLKKNFDVMVNDPQRGPETGWSKSKNWSWCDALFMAPPAMAGMAKATGNPAYLNEMNELWWDTYEYLYDQDEHLYYRDANYKIKPDGTGPRTKNGKKVFWGRGNGWVMGGLVRVLNYMPENYPDRGKYLEQYRQMAKKIASLQGKDGLWRSSLVDPAEFPMRETSSSAFFCYALAWGLNNKLLPEKEYLPAVKKAWKGLVKAVDRSGKLRWVQRVGHDPQKVNKEDTMEYAAGAFLLAGNEMIKLAD